MDVNHAMNKRLRSLEDTPSLGRAVYGDCEDSNGIDRISKLPNEILGLILSFLPTKEAIATTALSTRYKDLFPAIPNPQIVLYDTLLKNPIRRSSMQSIINLANMIEKLIRFNLPSIESLSLTLQVIDNERQIADWLGAFLPFNPKKLELNVSSYLTRPNCLVEKLHGCGLTSLIVSLKTSYVPEYEINLPNLKELSVSEARFSLVNVLVKGSSLLETLSVMECYGDVEENLSIKATLLSHLHIHNPCLNFSTALVLDAPNLKNFIYCGYFNQNYSVERLRSLDYAQFDVHEDTLPASSNPHEQAIRLLTSCCNARKMWLSGLLVSAFVDHSLPLPQFKNLGIVVMRTMGLDGWAFLIKLLKHAPKLHTLFVKEVVHTISIGTTLLEENSIHFKIRENSDNLFVLSIGRRVAAEPPASSSLA